MRRTLVGGLALVALTLAPIVALAQQQQSPLWVGTWKRNLAKSQYSGTPPTGEQTVKIEILNGLLQIMTTNITAQGQATPNPAYVIRFDGSERTVNAEQGTTVTYKWIDPMTYEGHNMAKGQPTTTTRYSLAPGGKTHTLTTTGKNALGQAVNNVVVYEKQ